MADLFKEVITAIADAGFDVYQREPDDTYAYFTDGTRIGVIGLDRLEGLTLTTVHRPNTRTGTGFRIEQGLSRIDRETLERAFAYSPGWPLSPDERAKTVKWKDWAHFHKADSWNAGLVLVAQGKGRDAPST